MSGRLSVKQVEGGSGCCELRDMLFIHHSCGGQLLAAHGPPEGVNCIYRTHPNGGGLRGRLEENRYRVHEASYGSRLGERTDLFDWLPKFRNQMTEVAHCDMQDECFSDDTRNRIVVFKCCFPNNAFEELGEPPGNASGPELTVFNARASYVALLEVFRSCPEMLFVCCTAPPLADQTSVNPLWKRTKDLLLLRDRKRLRGAELARVFNNWLSSPDGWLKNYPLPNVAVFDYYNILTGFGASNFAVYPTENGTDSHPSHVGNEKAAEAFVPFLNKAWKAFVGNSVEFDRVS